MNTSTRFLAGCLLAVPGLALANDFPTQARVEFVLRCMDAHGGQTYNTMYPCVCSVDKIADALSYDEYVEAEAYALLRSTPGERGGVFRDHERARELVTRYREVTAAAEKACFIAQGHSEHAS